VRTQERPDVGSEAEEQRLGEAERPNPPHDKIEGNGKRDEDQRRDPDADVIGSPNQQRERDSECKRAEPPEQVGCRPRHAHARTALPKTPCGLTSSTMIISENTIASAYALET
jgi:hypothetical protein